MYLKSIEIQGFKSFANKIRLEFQPGFTGIVGPNGSGKSNIADAVRWVLGEQRVKQLRGGSMQDVIFAGTELRKPLSFAYVAITFDNSDHVLPVDYNEVTVARRLYRSGESEYIMNGVNVRLKDVQELFMDTGIGREGYSIIGQGQIDRILSDKPEERRELFDEAAGIVKFKHRKDESVRKLTAEQSNLQRVNDILSELEKQVGPLEKQAKKAQIYLKEHEELRRLDVNAFLLENGKNVQERQDLEGKLQTAQQQLEETTRNLENNRTEYDALQESTAALEKEIEDARGKISQASIVRNKLEGDIKVFEEQIRSAKSSAEHFQTRKGEIAAQLQQHEEQKQSVLNGKSDLDAKVQEYEASVAKAQAVLADIQGEEKTLSDQIDALRNGSLDLLNQRAQIKARQAALKTRREQFEVRQSELNGKLISASSEEAEHDSRIRELTEQKQQSDTELTAIRRSRADLAKAIAEKKDALTREDLQRRQTETSYHQEKSRLDALVNLTERYEGFGGSVKYVMEHKSREAGLIGVVADLIKTDPRYENAIEVALGGSIQNIVTKDEATAGRMISLLKRDHAGRATFLPLSNIGNGQPFNMMGVLREPGIIGLADTLVKVSPEYQPVAKSLLGRIVVADNFDHAAAAERKFNHRIRMVTLDGELFTPGGAISGGAYRNSSNLLGRRREIAELEQKTKELSRQMTEADERIEQIRQERNSLRAKEDTLRMQEQNKELEQNRLQLLLAQEEEKKQASREGYESLQAENDSIEDTQAQLEKEEKDAAAELNASLEAEQQGQVKTARLQEQQKEVRSREDAQMQEISGLQVQLEKEKQKAGFRQQELDRIESEAEELRKEQQEIEENIRLSGSSMEEKTRNIEETKKTIEASHVQEDEAKAVLEEKNKDKAEASEQSAALLKDRDTLNDDKGRLDKEVFRLTTRRDQLETAMEDRINYIWSEYELTLTQAEEQRDESLTDLAAMKAEIKERKTRIRNLGPVNVNAIDEYKELSERYGFMKGQRDDLVKAADSLQKIIEELDNNMRRQFKEQFAKIQKEFDRVFKQLFGGGSGRLELMEDEDLLTAGVRVIAQPPGKKLVNMMQMSGGEKALTAISLLFAIQNLKPSPFCLLDEIEAALDESNVVRFADYIHRLTEHTQFIVITHRRGTMDRADRLYGITMQEKGVSTLVSVSLMDEKDLTE